MLFGGATWQTLGSTVPSLMFDNNKHCLLLLIDPVACLKPSELICVIYITFGHQKSSVLSIQQLCSYIPCPSRSGQKPQDALSFPR